MDKLSVLQLQNQKLAVQLEEKRRETRELEQRLEAQEEKERNYAQTLLCVDRLWHQLDQDVQHLCDTALVDLDKSGTTTTKPPAAATSTVAHAAPGPPQNPNLALLAAKDPYLAQLLAPALALAQQPGGKRDGDEEEDEAPGEAALSEVVGGVEEVLDECTEVEEKLRKRCAGSKRALARVLEAMRRLQAQALAAATTTSTPPPPTAAAAAPKHEPAAMEVTAAAAAPESVSVKPEQQEPTAAAAAPAEYGGAPGSGPMAVDGDDSSAPAPPQQQQQQEEVASAAAPGGGAGGSDGQQQQGGAAAAAAAVRLQALLDAATARHRTLTEQLSQVRARSRTPGSRGEGACMRTSCLACAPVWDGGRKAGVAQHACERNSRPPKP